MAWINPKTDWTKNDRFNYSDYNRIKNNLNYLHEKTEQLVKPVDIGDMGEDITSYLTYWDVNVFNLFEKNLGAIAKASYGKDYGYSQTFYPNGAFIKYDELNRIESACIDIYNMLMAQEAGLRKIPFVLGRFREVRI
jgi:hypothetical protein